MKILSSSNPVENAIQARFDSGDTQQYRLFQPLLELAESSPSLIVGYGSYQSMVRDRLIPYFHLIGQNGAARHVRALIIGGWVGTDTVPVLTASRFVAAIESRLRLIEGIELTVFPIANPEAYQSGQFLTEKQTLEGVRLWQGSNCSHIQVFERELKRQQYDLVIVLREHALATDLEIEAWTADDPSATIIADTCTRFKNAGPCFSWRINPLDPLYERSFTPVLHSHNQPSEIVCGLPAVLSIRERVSAGLGFLLGILHSFRQARAEGVL